ncbi:DUF2937 family protein [Thalassobaculum sp. OXR-137]|uniref:DUF2937 family protein n=1 Tax=Thalassobaculum sp. OXR-137 TaxID=3100173 RepID=UPI002AC934BF|nr:DUF2937 family protein [Thalassobaculum sp. OXR-137]WPZ35340.1 DUF2937 family protein [Thalassobaculum sp. OXR-137]
MFRMLRDLCLLLVVILGLTGGSQVSSFVDAYAQRLGGAVDELDRQVTAHRTEAAAQNLTLEAYLERHRTNADPAIQGSGRRLTAMVQRLDDLRAARAELMEAGPWTRPAVALRHSDSEILGNAYAEWRPGLTIDPRWGLVGAVLAWMLFWAVSTLLVRGFTTPRRRAPAR